MKSTVRVIIRVARASVGVPVKAAGASQSSGGLTLLTQNQASTARCTLRLSSGAG
ncbi:MAG: hypothetical protein JWQ08_1598 [Deinococcus sp.]|nr:hypothetical protein [Deinococcus sp.]